MPCSFKYLCNKLKPLTHLKARKECENLAFVKFCWQIWYRSKLIMTLLIFL